MPAKTTTGGVTVADVEKSLPKAFFVRRGHIMVAFGLTSEEMTALVPDVFVPHYLPPNKRKRGKKRVSKSRAVFVRSKVIAVARQWEAGR